MNVVFIPENPKYDRHILTPVLGAMMAWLNQPHATVEPARGNLRGYDNLRRWGNIESIIDREPMADLFLVCVDRDGDEGRRDALDHLERKARAKFEAEGYPEKGFFAIAACQEVEVWALGGLRDHPAEWTWDDVRTDPDVKDTYFADHAQRRGVDERQFGGRKALGEESGSEYRTLRQKCPELRHLEHRIQAWLEER